MRRCTTGKDADGRDSCLILSCYSQRQVLSTSQSGPSETVAAVVMADLKLTHEPRLDGKSLETSCRECFPTVAAVPSVRMRSQEGLEEGYSSGEESSEGGERRL